MKRASALFFIIVLRAVDLNALMITEIFYKGSALIRSEERFIEIMNDGTNSVDLSTLVVSVPKSDTETIDIGVEKGKFLLKQSDAVTDSLILPSGGYAVLLTEDYNRYARLLPFSPGCLVLKPKLKSFSGWSWAGRTGLIALRTNGVTVFRCGDYPIPADRDITDGESISLSGAGYSVTGISPGTNGASVLSSDRLIIRENESFVVRYRNTEIAVAQITAEVKVNNSERPPVILNRVSPGRWEANCFIPGLSHGDDVRVLLGGNGVLLRYLEQKPLSEFYRAVLINEIVTDPKTDYSGGGWTGNDGGGRIDDTDEWMELVNTADREIGLSNFCLLYRSKTSESVKELSFRTNAGFGKKSEVLSNYNYVVVSAGGGLSDNAAISLYDGYPYRDGRLVDELEYGGDSWNSAPSGKSSGKNDEAIARVPNAVYDAKYGDVFKKLPASYARANRNAPAVLWARDVTGSFTNTVYAVCPDHTNLVMEVVVKNQNDAERITLTNYGIYFQGTIVMKNGAGMSGDGFFNVQNGIRNTAVYDEGDFHASCRFLWAENGWLLPASAPDLQSAMVYPNPVRAGTKGTVVFGNLPEGAEVSVIDLYGNVLVRLINPENGILTWETDLKRGIYVAVIRKGAATISRKLLSR